MWFRHLDYAPETSVTEFGPAALDDLLERGDLTLWTPLVRAIARDPWGTVAGTVLKLCEARPRYGTSALFGSWIERLRGQEDPRSATLSQARIRAGLSQTQVAERMGISQSDVSK